MTIPCFTAARLGSDAGDLQERDSPSCVSLRHSDDDDPWGPRVAGGEGGGRGPCRVSCHYARPRDFALFPFSVRFARLDGTARATEKDNARLFSSSSSFSSDNARSPRLIYGCPCISAAVYLRGDHDRGRATALPHRSTNRTRDANVIPYVDRDRYRCFLISIQRSCRLPEIFLYQ